MVCEISFAPALGDWGGVLMGQGIEISGRRGVGEQGKRGEWAQRGKKVIGEAGEFVAWWRGNTIKREP
jgi:hypothetical protein